MSLNDLQTLFGCPNDFLKHIEINKILMPLYIDSAKTYLNLGIATLILTVTFREKVIGEADKTGVSLALIISWILLLFSIGLASLYQYVATKLVEARFDCEYYKLFDLFTPAHVYGAMLITFYLGVIIFSISAMINIRSLKHL